MYKTLIYLISKVETPVIYTELIVVLTQPLDSFDALKVLLIKE